MMKKCSGVVAVVVVMGVGWVVAGVTRMVREGWVVAGVKKVVRVG